MSTLNSSIPSTLDTNRRSEKGTDRESIHEQQIFQPRKKTTDNGCGSKGSEDSAPADCIHVEFEQILRLTDLAVSIWIGNQAGGAATAVALGVAAGLDVGAAAAAAAAVACTSSGSCW